MKITNREKRTIASIVKNNSTQIDYDKMADAIVRAEKNTSTEHSYVSDTFAFLTSSFFKAFAFVGRIFSVGLFLGTIYTCFNTLVWVEISEIIKNVGNSILFVLLSVLLFMFSTLLSKSAKELEKEKDKQFVVAVFSGVASFAAVIVALIALLKG